MARLNHITPIVPVADVSRTVAFFRDVLAFTPVIADPTYAYLARDGVAIRLVAADPDVDVDDPKRQLACYIDVDDVDAVYAQLKPALDALPSGRVRAPFDQDYGQREFHVIAGDGLLMFFGAPIAGLQDDAP